VRCPSLLFALAVLAQSQPPSPGAREAAQPKQYQTAPKQTEANSKKNLAPQVDQSGSVITVVDEQEPRNKSENKSPTNWWGILNAALLTLFTGALAWLAHRQHQAMDRQAGYMRDTLSETKAASETAREVAAAAMLSAKAAQSSAAIAERELLATQMAEVVIRGVFLNTRPSITPQAELAAEATNCGRTRADSVSLRIDVSVSNGKSLPDDTHGITFVLGPGDFQRGTVFLKSLLDESTCADIGRGDITLRYDCKVSYYDILGNEHYFETGGYFVPDRGVFNIDYSRAKEVVKPDNSTPADSKTKP
jgi:hypothetical protein